MKKIGRYTVSKKVDRLDWRLEGEIYYTGVSLELGENPPNHNIIYRDDKYLIVVSPPDKYCDKYKRKDPHFSVYLIDNTIDTGNEHELIWGYCPTVSRISLYEPRYIIPNIYCGKEDVKLTEEEKVELINVLNSHTVIVNSMIKDLGDGTFWEYMLMQYTGTYLMSIIPSLKKHGCYYEWDYYIEMVNELTNSNVAGSMHKYHKELPPIDLEMPDYTLL